MTYCENTLPDNPHFIKIHKLRKSLVLIWIGDITKGNCSNPFMFKKGNRIKIEINYSF